MSRRRAFLVFGVGVGVMLAGSALSGCGGDPAGTGGSPETGGGGAGGDGAGGVCRVAEPHEGPWFTEVTAELGLAKTDALEPVGTSVTSADLDGDGWADFYSAFFPAQREPAGTKRTRFLFMSRPDPVDPSRRIYVDATDESGLLATRDGEGGRGLTTITFGDLDNDGDVDAVGCAGEITTTTVDGCAAFLNDGTAHFTLAPESGDLELDVFSVTGLTLLDFDLDGILDLWPGTVGNWQYGPALFSHPRLYRGLGDGTFVEVSKEVGLPQTLTGGGSYRANFGLTSCDVDQDGDRDMIIGNYGVPIGANNLYRNDGGTFTDVASELDVDKGTNAGGFTFSITCGDLDDDGDVDLMTSEVHHAWTEQADFSSLLLNDTPAGEALRPFRRPSRAEMGLERPHSGNQWTEGDNIALFVDVDLDGMKDILLASSNYPQQNPYDPDWTHTWLYRQNESRTFEDVTTLTPWWDKDQQSLEGPSLADIDNDGDLDLIIGTGTYNSAFLGLTNAIHVYRNDVGQTQNWARVRLIGKGAGRSNRSGIGARVELTAGGRTQYQEVLGSWGHGNTQTDTFLSFGLGDACSIERLVVRWPDGAHTVTEYADLPANEELVITEDEPVPAHHPLPR